MHLGTRGAIEEVFAGLRLFIVLLPGMALVVFIALLTEISLLYLQMEQRENIKLYTQAGDPQAYNRNTPRSILNFPCLYISTRLERRPILGLRATKIQEQEQNSAQTHSE